MSRRSQTFTVTAIADELDDARVAAITQVLTGAGAEVLTSTWLSPRAPGVAAIAITLPERHAPDRARARALRHAVLAAIAPDGGLDLAVTTAAVAAPGPRLLVADMDSTLIQIEVIDELARRHGAYEEIAAVTARAMRGELDFEASLRARVARLVGLDEGAMADIAATLPIMDGAAALVRGFKRDGGFAAVVSGGFTFGTDVVRAKLGLDHAYANSLELAGGRLTGKLLGDVVTPFRKQQLVDELAAAHGLPLERVVAVGDGANDLLMLARAGLGVAFHAKPKVAAAADTALSGGGLERMLYVLGWTRAEIDALA
ncbi:MAG TPA: phosphoserine phosphatase SerB [Kofleriaceae bacterium]|nr:phosphoserine phosphatase SerB [Kofleriaceae bacterium]